MARSKELLKQRNSSVKRRFNELSAAHPQWRYDALLDALKAEFFISKRTIGAIINNEGSYKVA